MVSLLQLLPSSLLLPSFPPFLPPSLPLSLPLSPDLSDHVQGLRLNMSPLLIDASFVCTRFPSTEPAMCVSPMITCNRNHTKHVQMVSLLQLLPSSLLLPHSSLLLPSSLFLPCLSSPFPSFPHTPPLPLLLLFSSFTPSLRQCLSSGCLSPAQPPLFLYKLANQSSQ